VVSLTFAPNVFPVDGQFSDEYSMSYSVAVQYGDPLALTKALIAFCEKTVSVPFNTALAAGGYSKVTFYRTPTAATLIIVPITNQPTRSPFVLRGINNPPTAGPFASTPTAPYSANISVIQVRLD
jgi:hypothetical protein